MTEQKNAEEIFNEAVGLSDPTEQAEYLDHACGGDEKLRAQVETLLQWHKEAGDFLEVPAVDSNVTLETSAAAEGPGTVIGRYKLLEKVGEGGMATVYMAEQKEPIRRRVALKVIKLGMDTKQVIARFEAERQALAMMDHPNIAKVLDAGTTESGRPYFVMELVRGVSLTEFCDKNNLNTRERLELFISVCQAVHHAHQKGIIHRDIKPSNVMVTLHDGQPVAKVIDFGIAKAMNQQLTERTVFTRYAQMIGTPEYMSPEQAEMSGLDVDIRTDVFSLGVLLYELLTGKTPFDAEYLLRRGYEGLLKTIREEEPTRPSTKLSTLGEALTEIAKHRRTSPDTLQKLIRTDLDWIVMKTLEKDRNRRYDSVSEFVADIKRHLNNEPVLAGRPGTIYRIKKFVRRRRTLVTTVTTMAAVIAAGFIATTLMYLQAEWSREREAAARLEAQTVADFLSDDLLASVHPERAKGQEVTVRYILRAASENLAAKFQESPLPEAKIRQAIGLTYHKLGDYQAAEPHLLRALEIRRLQLGEEDPSTLASLHHLGTLQMDCGRYKEAEALLLKATEMRKKVLGDDHPDTLASMGELAWLYLCEGRIADGDLLARNLLSTGRRVLGEEHPVVLRSMATSAFLSIIMFRFAEGHELANKGYEISRRVLGEEHEQTLAFMTQITWACIFEKQFDAAEAVGTKTLDLCRKVLGQDHMLTILATSHLGSTYSNLGQYDKAHSLQCQAVEAAQRVLGEGHLFTLYFMERLIMLCDEQKWYDELDSALTKAIMLCRNNPGAALMGQFLWRLDNRVATLRPLSREHFEAGRYEEALAVVTHQEDLVNIVGNDTREMLPSDLAIQTLSLYRLGNEDGAMKVLDRLRLKYEDGNRLFEEEQLYTVEQNLAPKDGPVHEAWDHLQGGRLDRVRGIMEILPTPTMDNDHRGSALSLRKATARAYCLRGKIAEFHGNYRDAAEAHQTGINVLPEYAPPMSELARLLATCPVQGLRDGPKAMELGTKVCAMTNWAIPKYVNGLAAACAETGDFAAAVKWEKCAIELLSPQGQWNWKANYQMRLRLYELDKPYHMQSPRSLVARWQLDQAIDGKVLDSSGNGLHGTLVGDAKIIDDPDRGRVLSLDGRGHVDCGGDLRFDAQGPITASAWVKLRTLDRDIISKGLSPWALACKNGLPSFSCTFEGQRQIVARGSMNLRDGKWHHLAGTYDSTKVCLYVDGLLARSEQANGTIVTNGFNVYIGENSQLMRNGWNGLIDDVRIYNYALSEHEIKALASGQEFQNQEK